MEDYVKTLLEQIRCKKAHPAIEQELRSHILEQAAANEEAGMEQKEAFRCAVLDMGDPVEAGVQLDRIHRPQMAWDVVAVMLLIALAGIFIHVVIGLGAPEINSQPQGMYIGRAVGSILAGFAVMLLVYRLDYSIFAKNGTLCAGIFLAFLTLGMVFGVRLQDAYYISVGGISFSVVYAMFLYVPLYGAVLYRYHGSGMGGALKCLLFLLYPVFLAVRMHRISVVCLLLAVMSVMLTTAVAKGWFSISKKWFLAAYWTALVALPAVWTFCAVNGFGTAVYQQARLAAFLGKGPQSYVTELLDGYVRGCRLFGGTGEAVAGVLPNYYSDYILTFLTTSYGLAAACAVCLLVAVAAVKAFRIALGQKNRLGMMMGLGSGLVLLANTGLNVLENMGALPASMSFLPFFSYTGSGTLVSYALMGLVLSVYRYKNVPLACGKKETVFHSNVT